MRSSRPVLSLLAAAAAGLALLTAPAPAGAAVVGTPTTLISQASSRCLTVEAASTSAGAKLVVFTCNGKANQAWTLTASGDLRVYTGTTEKCLDGNGAISGARLIIWPCTGGPNQKFTLDATGQLHHQKSGLCPDVTGGGSSPDNTPVALLACSASATNQRWTQGTITTPPPPPPPPPGSGLPVAPYIDMGAWPTPVLPDIATAGNQKALTLAFITASGCKAMWFNAYDPRAGWKLDEITTLRGRGGDVKVSFGGATGIELATMCTTVDSLAAEYQAVITAYKLKYVDFDIEGAATADTAAVARRSQALAQVQKANPGLRISLTLPALPEGLTADGLALVRSARDAGVALDLVNVMAMDYYRAGDYGAFAVQAGQSLFSQLKGLYPSLSTAALWKMVAVTPMLGQNDDGHIYDQAAARQLVSFAQTNHLGMLSFWETTRDRNACTGALYMCTNIPQSPYEFSKIFAGYTG